LIVQYFNRVSPIGGPIVVAGYSILLARPSALSALNSSLAAHVVFGALVKHHTYDGLGRLVRTQSPYPSPELSDGGSAPSGSTSTGSAACRRW